MARSKLPKLDYASRVLQLMRADLRGIAAVAIRVCLAVLVVAVIVLLQLHGDR